MNGSRGPSVGASPSQARRTLLLVTVSVAVLTLVATGTARAGASGAPRSGVSATGADTLWGQGGHEADTWPLGPPGWLNPGTCRGVFNGPAVGSLTKSTDAGPTGSTVLPGQRITVTLSWKPGEFVWSAPSKIADCVQIGTHVVPFLTKVQGPGPVDGTITFSYVVPRTTGGLPICDRGVAWGRAAEPDRTWASSRSGQGEDAHSASSSANGRGDDTSPIEKSAVLCYTIFGAAAPEVPTALLLPVAGLFLGGGAYVVVRRRRQSEPERSAPG